MRIQVIPCLHQDKNVALCHWLVPVNKMTKIFYWSIYTVHKRSHISQANTAEASTSFISTRVACFIQSVLEYRT